MHADLFDLIFCKHCIDEKALDFMTHILIKDSIVAATTKGFTRAENR